MENKFRKKPLTRACCGRWSEYGSLENVSMRFKEIFLCCHLFPWFLFDDTLHYLTKVLCDSTKHSCAVSLRNNTRNTTLLLINKEGDYLHWARVTWTGASCRLHTCCFTNIFSFISNSIFNRLSRNAAFFMIVAIVISFWWSSSVRSEISFLILSCSELWYSSSWQGWLLICSSCFPENSNKSFIQQLKGFISHVRSSHPILKLSQTSLYPPFLINAKWKRYLQ